MKRKWLAVMAILAVLLGLLSGFVFAAPLTAQVAVPVPDPELTANMAVVNDDPPVGPPYKVFISIVFVPERPEPPASAYAAALSQALADCAGMALNQVCYGGGSVTLDGGGPLTAPGQVASLDGVSGLTLVSPDADHWSVALLRLAADSPTPDLGLTLLVFGNVEIHDLTLFDAAAGNWDVAPALSFSSSPAPGQDPVTGGLIVYNPSHEDPLSIRLNGADLTLASSAVVQAQPGIEMTVTMATGTALVSTAAGEGAVLTAYQVTVPLDGSGTAAGAPTTPTAIDESLLAPLAPPDEDDLLAPLVPARTTPPLDLLASLLADFDSAQSRCMQGNSRQVYRVMYYARMLKDYRAVPDDLMSLINVQVMQCATFEFEFNSVITGTSSVAWGSMHLQAQGMIVRYDMDGHLVQPGQASLIHLRYDFDFRDDCPYYLVITDGMLHHEGGYMRINRSRLDISTALIPADVDEIQVYTCPEGPPIEFRFAFWPELFFLLHQSEADVGGFLFAPDHWKYTGNHILAEAIISGRETYFQDSVCTGDTWMFMLHKPGS